MPRYSNLHLSRLLDASLTSLHHKTKRCSGYSLQFCLIFVEETIFKFIFLCFCFHENFLGQLLFFYSGLSQSFEKIRVKFSVDKCLG